MYASRPAMASANTLPTISGRAPSSGTMSGLGSMANVHRTTEWSPVGSTTQSSAKAWNMSPLLSSTRYAHRVGSSQASIVSRYVTPSIDTWRRVPTPGSPSPSYDPRSRPGNHRVHVDGSAAMAANTTFGGACTSASKSHEFGASFRNSRPTSRNWLVTPGSVGSA